MNEFSPEATEPLRILVVDDQVDSADALVALLQALGCVTAVAYSGPEALGVVSNFNPQLAFIDLEMPEMSGSEVVRHLQANEQAEGIQLVCLTGSSVKAPVGRAFGFDELVRKPMDLSVLKQIIASARRAQEPVGAGKDLPLPSRNSD